MLIIVNVVVVDSVVIVAVIVTIIIMMIHIDSIVATKGKQVLGCHIYVILLLICPEGSGSHSLSAEGLAGIGQLSENATETLS